MEVKKILVNSPAAVHLPKIVATRSKRGGNKTHSLHDPLLIDNHESECMEPRESGQTTHLTAENSEVVDTEDGLSEPSAIMNTAHHVPQSHRGHNTNIQIPLPSKHIMNLQLDPPPHSNSFHFAHINSDLGVFHRQPIKPPTSQIYSKMAASSVHQPIPRYISNGPIKGGLGRRAKLNPISDAHIKLMPRTPEAAFKFGIYPEMSETARNDTQSEMSETSYQYQDDIQSEVPESLSIRVVSHPQQRDQAKIGSSLTTHQIQPEVSESSSIRKVPHPQQRHQPTVGASLATHRVDLVLEHYGAHLQPETRNQNPSPKTPSNSSHNNSKIVSSSLSVQPAHPFTDLGLNSLLSTSSSQLARRPSTTTPATLVDPERNAIMKLRQERHERVREEQRLLFANSTGPRVPQENPVQYDKQALLALQRMKAKEYSEKLRLHLLEIEKSQQHLQIKRVDRRISIEDFDLSRFRVSTAGHISVSQTNSAFETMLGLSEEAEGQFENPGILNSLMPERKMEDRATIEDQSYGSVLNYAKSQTTKVMFPVTIDGGETEGTHFWTDYEILLERQYELEKEAISNFGHVDLQVNTTLLSRFGKSDVASLVWHLFLYARGDGTIFGLDATREIYNALNDNLLDEQALLTELEKVLEKRWNTPQKMELKSYAGHLRRIILTSTESKLGMSQLLARSCAFLSYVLFTVVPVSFQERQAQIRDAELSYLDTQCNTSKSISSSAEKRASVFAHSISIQSDNDEPFQQNDAANVHMQQELEHVLLNSEATTGPLNWHSRFLELCVRYPDRLMPERERRRDFI